MVGRSTIGHGVGYFGTSGMPKFSARGRTFSSPEGGRLGGWMMTGECLGRLMGEAVGRFGEGVGRFGSGCNLGVLLVRAIEKDTWRSNTEDPG